MALRAVGADRLDADAGLLPETLDPISSTRKRRTFSASSVPEAQSIPVYTSSVFSPKITTFSFSGAFMGDGTPLIQRTGQTQE